MMRAFLDVLYLNPVNYDYLTATLIEGLSELHHNVKCTENSNYGNKLPDDELVDFAEQADLIIVGSGTGIKCSFLKSVSNQKIVYIDGSDYQLLDIPEDIPFKAVFKRELCCAVNSYSEHFIFPLPFAAEKRYFSPPREKDILVSFLANMRMNPLRQSIHTRLQIRNQVGIISGSTDERAYSPLESKPLPIETPGYHELLSRSIISINVPGFGYDCARFWEILAARAMLFTYTPDISIPHYFQDGVNFVTFSSIAEFEVKLEFYLERPSLVSSIAEKGHEHLCRYHTTKRRAEYFLKLALKAVQRPGYCRQYISG